jgi:hypothetical protein
MLVCVVSGLCHGVSTQVEFCFLFLGVRVSPSFPFLLLGLCVCVRVCFRKSCFVLPAALAWFRFAGPSLPPSLLFSLPPSRPPLSGGRGPGVPGMSLVPPLSAHPAPSPRRPHARPRLRGMSPHHPGIAWRGEGGGIAALSWQPPGERSPGSSPFLCGRGRVASRRSAAEAPGRARAFGRPALWRPRRPATATRPRDVRAGCREPPGGRLYIVPPPPELRRALQEGCDSAAGPEAELSDTGYAGGDSPGGAEA